jgi:hypothetical protein
VCTLISCTDKKVQIDALENEVMAIHDEVMPKSEEIMSLKGKIKAKLAAIDSTSAVYKKMKISTDSINYLLDSADNQMMDWMMGYSGDSLKMLSEDKAAAYLLDQKGKIEKVKALTLKNIEQAKAFLK